MDPILKDKYRCLTKKLRNKDEFEKIDLFKADIYSLGLTYFITLTGKN